MSTPSRRTCVSVSRRLPRGQMTVISQPASVRAAHSCQTRRSSGTDRFSTRTSALPGSAYVPPTRIPAGCIRQADEIDDELVVAHHLRDTGERRAYDHDLCALDGCLQIFDEQSG